MSGGVGEALQSGLEAIRRVGAEGEVYVEDGRRAKVVVSGGRVESIEERRERGAGIRVFEDARVGFAFTTDLSAASLATAAEHAHSIARHLDRDEAWRLPAALDVPPLPFPDEDPEIAGVTMARRVEMATAVESAARALDPRVGKARQSVVNDLAGEAAIAHTRGLSTGFAYSRAIAYIQLTATEAAESQSGYHAEFALGPGGLDPEEIGREAARRALARLGSRPGPTDRIPVILDREVVAGLLDALAPAFSGLRVVRRTSPLAGRLGEPIASGAVTLVDDPRLPGGYGSSPMDGEGMPTHKVVLVEEGVLRGYLHDTYSSGKLGFGGPGNALRGSHQSPPRIGPMNLLLLPGELSREGLLERAGEGVFVNEVMGLHTVDPTSGDFSLGGSGHRIVRGRLGEPVEKLAFAGNLMELLRAVTAVGSDLKLFPGGGGSPSVLVSDLSVAGAG